MSSTTHRQIIRGGYVLNSGNHQAEPADVLLEGDHIAALLAPGGAAPEGAEPIDAANRLLIPGLINAHTHSHGGIAKGMGDRWTAVPRRDLEKAQMQPGEAVINA